MRTLIHGYYACVSYVDAQLGKVLDELKKLDLEENTIIMLWTDHGWKLGDYGWWCKHTANEIDTRVPLIVKVPNKQGNGKRSKALVELIDMYPTLCDLAEIPTPKHVQGYSFAPLMDNPDRSWKKAAFSIWAGKDPSNVGYSLRSGNYRYTEWRTFKGGELLSQELYDHSNGSLADKNLATNPENGSLLEKFSKLLKGGYLAAQPQKE
ncbi:MAG: sulfatase-like hydrolase/transferase [Planctomycetes bacterium]|nr:sulfatase-like hydrolase/transferase [Planctomycetota bacterium]